MRRSAKPRQRLIGGKYELIERAGEGGMAVVWQAVTGGNNDLNFQTYVDTTPEPATGLLTAAAALVLVAWRRTQGRT